MSFEMKQNLRHADLHQDNWETASPKMETDVAMHCKDFGVYGGLRFTVSILKLLIQISSPLFLLADLP